ncbi:hypothetical protein HPB50_029339 [Hyalomma asiaticum]|nr:hypothetical protein HPB50_029339 [Hyalomma asiaticum]
MGNRVEFIKRPYCYVGEEVQQLEDDILSRQPSLVDAWLRLESLRDLHQWQPYRPELSSEEVTSEDPERMVLFEDVAPALFRLRQPAAMLHLFRPGSHSCSG